jgi:lipoyl(octanoyl) transferase
VNQDAEPFPQPSAIRTIDLGRMGYGPAYAQQEAWVERVLASRVDSGTLLGVVLLVEHPPVITMTPRARAGANLIATPQMLARAGVEVVDTDRGGDVTYHGPGQLVAYPIVDLQRLRLGLHEHMRVLESAVIETLADLGVRAGRDPSATGVWLDPGDHALRGRSDPGPAPMAKVCAMGVRVRKWVTMHGLALNVDPDLAHFSLIVPCGLVGRPVTSLRAVLGESCPSMERVKGVLAARLTRAFNEKAPA